MLILRGEQGANMGLIQALLGQRASTFSSHTGGKVFLCQEFR